MKLHEKEGVKMNKYEEIAELRLISTVQSCDLCQRVRNNVKIEREGEIILYLRCIKLKEAVSKDPELKKFDKP